MSSTHSNITPASSRPITLFANLDSAVGEVYEWVQVDEAKSDMTTRDAEFRKDGKQAVRP